MRVAGIITEYNPLHNGHIYHIEETRKVTGCDYIIAVMSGDFVQRGEPAVADKYIRTEWALKAGVDLVMELPTVFSLSSAEGFAFGAMRALAKTRVVNSICFGSEINNIKSLYSAAKFISNETPEFQKKLKDQLSLGKSYPRARYDALENMGAPKEVLLALKTPNNILGVEYIKNMIKFMPKCELQSIERIGGQYNDDALSGTFSSATAIREALYTKNSEVFKAMPAFVSEKFSLVRPRAVRFEDAFKLLLYSLRRMNQGELAQIAGVHEGLENLLLRAAHNSASPDEFFDILKSKRYTMARCKRISMCALLGITKNMFERSMQNNASYIHILGFKNNARNLVSAISKSASCPVLLRKSDTLNIKNEAAASLALDILAHDIYGLISHDKIERDFMRQPVII